MYQFIETICYENGGFHNILHHEERMRRTRLHFFGRKDQLSLESALTGSLAGFHAVADLQSAPFPCAPADLQSAVFQKSLSGAHADTDLQSAPFQSGNLADTNLQSAPNQTTHQKVKCRISYAETIESIEFEPYIPKVIQSLQLVYDDRIDYGYKYKDRSVLNALLERRGDADEILIVKNGLVTDTSYSNIVFLRDGKWFTPQVPLLSGTRRADYLQKRLIFPLNIAPGEIGQFEEARLINAMLSIEEAIPIKIENIFR